MHQSMSKLLIKHSNNSKTSSKDGKDGKDGKDDSCIHSKLFVDNSC